MTEANRADADTITSLVARFSAELSYEELPEEVKLTLRTLTLDSLSCGVGGVATPPGEKTALLIEKVAGEGRSKVWATGTRLPPMFAAYVNASLANALDFDDTYSGAGHPGATVVPVVWATAEEVGASGQDLLTGIAVGYELSVRLGLALRPTTKRHREAFGYGHQTLGAAAAAGKVRGLTEVDISTVLGIAAAHSPVPHARRLNLSSDERPLSWLKNNYGWMALGAVLSCDFASLGFPGPKDILDGPDGYWNMAGTDQFDASQLLDGLGQYFLSTNTEVKPYACCRWTHSAIEAADVLGKRISGKSGIGKVARVDVEWFAGADVFDVVRPMDTVDAQFSLPFVVAAALSGASLTTPIEESALTDPTITALAEKVETFTDPAFEAAFASGRGRPARVSVVMENGERLSETVETPMGHPSRVIGWDAVAEKCERLVGPILGTSAAERLIQMCEGLDSVESVEEAWSSVVGSHPR